VSTDFTEWSTPLTKTELAYRQVRQLIIEGTLPPDTAIDQEVLAQRLGLSTTPVREALRLLESEKLVVNRPNRRTVVTPFDRELLDETYTVRLLLDPFAASLAATNATDELRERLRQLVAEPGTGQTPAERLRADRDLHRTIYAAPGNSTLTQMLDLLWDRSARYRMAALKHATGDIIALDEHRAIVDAVTGGNADLASQLMHEHVTASRQRLQRWA
jgi:DNA-binding GntR family transcriptional regulator